MNKSVMKCCICNNENIGQFITINNKKYHLCCIEQLQQENKKYKEVIDKVIEYIKSKKCKYDGWEITTQLYEDEIRQLEDILKEVSE